MTDDEIIAIKYQHGIEASVPPDMTRSALKQFLDCAEASHIESDIMAVCTHTRCSFVIYNRTSDMPCPYAEDVLCKCVIVQHRCGGLCTVRFTDNKDIFTVGVVHEDDDEIKRFTKYATEWDKKPSRIIPANPEPMPNRSIRMRNEATISEHGRYLLGTHTSDVHYREFLRYIAKVSDYWMKLKELKVGDQVSIKDAETFCDDCDKLIHKVGDIKEIVQFAITQQKMETKDMLAWLDDLKTRAMERVPDELEDNVNHSIKNIK